jgi:hypothetical protein
MVNYAFLSFIDQCFQVLQPLMYSTCIRLGGLGFPPYTIGVIMSIWGLCNGVVQVVAFAPIRALVGQKNLWRMAIGCYLFSFGAFPLMSWLAKMEGRVWWGVWIVLIAQLACMPFSYFGYGEHCSYYTYPVVRNFFSIGCIFIYISNAAPSRDTLGTTNGLAQMTASTMRTIAVASSMFSFSLEHRLAGGTEVYWVLWTVVIAALYASRRL